MAIYDVAHFQEQGQDVIMVVVARRPRDREWVQLQRCASSAGLAGLVVAVWDRAGIPGFLGPTAWGPFLEGLTWDFVRANVNRTLSCG